MKKSNSWTMPINKLTTKIKEAEPNNHKERGAEKHIQLKTHKRYDY
jgi:hypothetical protein